ncbi:hypothetical protein MKW92_012331 [Papaver armeniacum]|nr:hypothetical protein MKW92_012331 [Papaver armeniacum]
MREYLGQYSCSAQIAILVAIRDVCKLAVKEQLAHMVIYSYDEYKFNKDIIVGLIRSELLNLAECSMHTAKLTEALAKLATRHESHESLPQLLEIARDVSAANAPAPSGYLVSNNEKANQSTERLHPYVYLNAGKSQLKEPVHFLYKGASRVLLVTLHDFPEFLCNYHFSFWYFIPTSCIQMQNVIFSALPRNMRLPDPSTPNLKID